MTQHINETAARGGAKRLVREWQERYLLNIAREVRRIERSCPPRTRYARFRQLVSAYRETVRETLLYEETEVRARKGARGKPPKPLVHRIYSLMPCEGENCDRSWVVHEDAIPFAPSADVASRDLPVLLSGHAVVRVFERLNTADLGIVLEELKQVSRMLLLGILEMARSQEWWLFDMRLRTPNGHLVVRFERNLVISDRIFPQGVIAATWLHTLQATERQLDEAEADTQRLESLIRESR